MSRLSSGSLGGSRAVDPCLGPGGDVVRINMYCDFVDFARKFKLKASTSIQASLPSPHSELVMGMVLGEDRLAQVPRYNDVLKTAGLIHVVVVSGYNITLVFSLFIKAVGSQYKLRNIVLGACLTFIYVGISGFGIPGLRSWVMGTIAVVFKYYGRPATGLKALVFSALVIVCLAPYQLFSVSFQLSFMATLGIMVIPDILNHIVGTLGIAKNTPLLSDFITSLSAQLAVCPILIYYFGSLSVVSFVANPLVLWVVPLCTILGGVLVASTLVSSFLSYLIALVIYPFLDLFVFASEFFASLPLSSISVSMNGFGVLIYYAFLLIILLAYRRRTLCGN